MIREFSVGGESGLAVAPLALDQVVRALNRREPDFVAARWRLSGRLDDRLGRGLWFGGRLELGILGQRESVEEEVVQVVLGIVRRVLGGKEAGAENVF